MAKLCDKALMAKLCDKAKYSNVLTVQSGWWVYGWQQY